MRRFTTALGTVACLAIIGNLMAPLRTFAKDPAEPESKVSKAAAAESPDLPTCLEKLKLSDDQKTKAREIVHKYEGKIDAAWKKFSEKYMETLRAEVALMAAVEDNLSESQRDGLRNERRKAAHSEKSADDQESRSNQANHKAVKPANPKSAVVIDEIDEISLGNGITLTIEQEAIADKISNRYVRRLRRLHREIRSIHDRLISLEFDKLVELEKVLTKDQLAQLREERQSPPDEHHKVTSTTAKNAETND